MAFDAVFRQRRFYFSELMSSNSDSDDFLGAGQLGQLEEADTNDTDFLGAGQLGQDSQEADTDFLCAAQLGQKGFLGAGQLGQEADANFLDDTFFHRREGDWASRLPR